MRRVVVGLAGLLVLMFGCGSSSGDPPIDPLATAYCIDAGCSEFPNCERLITETLNVVCQAETRVYYECVTENACDTTPCDADFAAREACLVGAPKVAARTRP